MTRSIYDMVEAGECTLSQVLELAQVCHQHAELRIVHDVVTDGRVLYDPFREEWQVHSLLGLLVDRRITMEPYTGGFRIKGMPWLHHKTLKGVMVLAGIATNKRLTTGDKDESRTNQK